MTGPSRDTWYDATESDRLRYEEALHKIAKACKDMMDSPYPHPDVDGFSDGILYTALFALGELR